MKKKHVTPAVQTEEIELTNMIATISIQDGGEQDGKAADTKTDNDWSDIWNED